MAVAAAKQVERINEEELPALKKIVRDAANAAKHSDVRRELKRILDRIGNATAGIRADREVDISPVREAELEDRLAAAKTDSQRREAGRGLEELRRVRASAERERDELASQNAERRRRHVEKQERKKIGRLLRKLGRTKPQEGT